MQSQAEITTRTIVRLERLKGKVYSSENREELLDGIDTLIELEFEIMRPPPSSEGSHHIDLHSNIKYLKDLRASALHITDEQVHDFCKELVMLIAMLQFDLWKGSKQELYSLLDALEQ